jgi:hypothetical protein
VSLFFKKSPRFELSPEFYKELGDSLIENLIAKTKRDTMGSVIENPDEAIEMLGAVQRSARTLISAFRMSPVQSTALDNRIAQTRDLVGYCDALIESLRSDHVEERIQQKVENMLTILVIVTEQGLHALQKSTGNKSDHILDQALRGRSTDALNVIAGARVT